MRVILLQDIDNIGKKYEVKEIKDGYARNFLIPKGLAKPATKETLRLLEEEKAKKEEKAKEELKEAQEIASKLEGIEVIIPVKIGEEGQLFEKITAQKISERLKELGFEINKNQVDLLEPIEELGEFQAKIKLNHNLESDINLIISEEKKD